MKKGDKNHLHKLYKEAVESTELSINELATIFNFGEFTDSARAAIAAKVSGQSGKMPTKSDVHWVQFLAFLKKEGYDLNRVKFDQSGALSGISKNIKP